MRNQLISRESYIHQIRPFVGKDIIKVLIGMHRTGKSFLLALIKRELVKSGVSPEFILQYNFESFQTLELRTSLTLYDDIEKSMQKKGTYYLLLDEIQEVEDWEALVNSLRVDFDVDIYLTGSNAQLLSGELATLLAGRYVEIAVYPFSFREFLEMAEVLELKKESEELFENYLELGGMPFLANLELKREPSLQYLDDIYRSVLLKDVIERYRIRDVDLLERIILYVISNIGRTFSAKSISDYLKNEKRRIASETVYNYIKACEEACLLFRVPRQDLVGKKILKTQEKIFVCDHGLRQAVYGRNLQNIEQILENIIFMELMRRGYRITVGKVLQREIDFVADKQEHRLYFQVCYLLATEEVIDREFSVLEGLKDNYPKYVLSLDKTNFSRNGINHMHIKDFLLSAI